MGTYNIPRNVKGEGRILFIFSIKALMYTGIGALVGLPFYFVMSAIGLKIVGIIIIVGVFLIIIYIKHLLCFKKGEKTSENNNTTILEDLMPEGN